MLGIPFFSVLADDIDKHFLECSEEYPDQKTSQYTLPYLEGHAYIVGQGNCTDGSHESGSDQAYAYDFDMPMRSDIVAARGGEVIEVEERYRDHNGKSGQENYVLILHDDSSVAGYYHLSENGSLVVVGDRVNQRQLIAKSGNTGDSSEPHLHFEVLECFDCDTLPINFVNTRDHEHGLSENELYRAR